MPLLRSYFILSENQLIMINSKYFSLLLLMLTAFSCIGQDKVSIQSYDSLYYASKIDSLNNLYGQNKQLPEGYELPVLIALSHFPELKELDIRFREATIKTTLNARPLLTSLLLRKKTKRKYIVRINTTEQSGMITLNEVTFSALIGLFGHEFCHFIDYNQKNFFGVMKRAFAYTNDKSKEKFEKEIDMLTIERGLGLQLYSWAYFVQYQSDASEEYKTFKRKIYLEPQEIETMLND